jgi:dinuclear metal center YbgI/SA1388 family protein
LRFVRQLREVLTAIEGWYDPSWAQSWDAVGLVCGDRDEPVERVVLAVDAVPVTVGEAIQLGAGLLLTHHPLLLSGVHGVPAEDPKGGLVHRMIRGRVAHYVAHTNADVADPGVSDALAARLGLAGLRPLEPVAEQFDKLVVFVPLADAEPLVDTLAAAGAGRLGAYDRCAWAVDGWGTFRPGANANPSVGRAGEVEVVAETRIEMLLPRRLRGPIIAALRAGHPYEEPAFDLLPVAEIAGRRGTGRLGELGAPTTLREFALHAARALPATTWGVRASGDPNRTIRTVAVCGGAGGSLIEAARAAGADAYLTADLRHHTAVEAVTEHGAGAMALLDAAHWATESPWLDQVAVRLRERFGTTVNVIVSTQVTDPWTVHAPSSESSP